MYHTGDFVFLVLLYSNIRLQVGRMRKSLSHLLLRDSPVCVASQTEEEEENEGGDGKRERER